MQYYSILCQCRYILLLHLTAVCNKRMCDGCTDGTGSTCPQCPVPPYPSIDPHMAHGHMAHPHRSRSSPPRVLISGHRGPGLGAGTIAGDSGGRSPGGPRFRGRYLTTPNIYRVSVRVCSVLHTGRICGRSLNR